MTQTSSPNFNPSDRNRFNGGDQANMTQDKYCDYCSDVQRTQSQCNNKRKRNGVLDDRATTIATSAHADRVFAWTGIVVLSSDHQKKTSYQGDCLSASDKVVCLLWVAFLIAGPTEAQVAWFLEHIFSVTTDMGTATYVSKCKDIVR